MPQSKREEEQKQLSEETECNEATENDSSKEASQEKLNQIIENAPAGVKRELQEFFSMSLKHDGRSPQSRLMDNLGEKLTEDHINVILANSDKSDHREFTIAKNAQLFNYLLILLGIGAFIWLTIFLAKTNREVYYEIVKIVALFAGGFGLGYGVKAYRSRSE